MNTQSTPVDRPIPKPVAPAAAEQVELSEAECKFLAECEAAYEANKTELYTLDEVVAFIKRKK